MKVDEITQSDAEKQIAEIPKRVVGKWKSTLEDLRKKNKGAKISGLTRGQIAALVRQCKDSNFECGANYKEGFVVVKPKPAKKPKAE